MQRSPGRPASRGQDVSTCSRSVIRQEGDDPRGSGGRRLVLPHAQHEPAFLREPFVSVEVTRVVDTELGAPPLRVRRGPRSMLRASVPEAAVHEHRHSGAREGDVDAPAGTPRDGVRHSVPVSGGVKQSSHSKLGNVVPALERAHPTRDLSTGGAGVRRHVERRDHVPILPLRQVRDLIADTPPEPWTVLDQLERPF